MAANIKDKIAKLLALADSPNENEAKAALLKARALMAEHKLCPDDCQKAASEKVVRELTDITCTAMTNPWAVGLSAVIAEHYCCKAFRQRVPGRKVNTIGFVGLEDDFEVCKRIFLYAYDCVISTCKSQIKRDRLDEPGTYREKCNAYGRGFVAGVNKAFEEQKEQHQEWGLVLVVPQAVTDAMADMGKPTAFGKIKRNRTADAYRELGYQDGMEFDPGSRIASKPAAAALGGAV